MKTAVSIPDDVFAEADRLARQLKRSRSDLYTRALSEYIGRHASDRVREAMDRVVTEIGDAHDNFAQVASRGVLERSQW